MSLINSKSFNKEAQVSKDNIAKEDVVIVNEAGQRVVLVHKGQPIPAGVEVPKTEDKARRSSKKK